MPKNATSTKAGPGRKHRQGERKTNSARRHPGGCGEIGMALRNVQTARNLAAIQARRPK